MKVLVTGASGFVGGYVVRELLRRRHAVTGLVRRESSVRGLVAEGLRPAVGDISVADSLREPLRGQDVVIHLAAVVGRDPGGWDNHLSQGVRGTENVAQAALLAGVSRLVHMSSCVVYRAPPGADAVTEDSPVEDRIEPWNHYLRQKVLCEEVMRRFSDRLPVTMIRPPTVIGAGDPGLVPLLTAISRSPLGALARDDQRHFPVVVAADLAEGIAAAAEASGAAGRTYNLAAARALTKAELLREFENAGVSMHAGSSKRALAVSTAARSLEILERMLASLGSIATLPRRLAVRRFENHARRRAQPDLKVDSSRARRELGFDGTRDLSQSIRSAVAWHLTTGSSSPPA